MVIFRVLLAALLLLVSGLNAASAKEVVGWIEKVKIYPGGLVIKAKVDTGAKSSSLHCKCITPIKRNGQNWVSFTVENDEGQTTRIEKPITRIAKIKRHFGKEQNRFVVRMGVCLDDVYKETDITLVDREGFNYPMLIGRRFMEDDFIVDPGAKFLRKPSCKNAPTK